MTAIIVCNGSIQDYSFYKKYFERAELIVCADGGALHLRRFGVMPHVLMGDFDSISGADLDFFRSQGVEIVPFPAEKDMTDTEIAVEYVLDKGYKEIILIGGLGTRLDHSIANVLVLKTILDRGAAGKVVNEHNEIMLIRDRIRLEREEGLKVTLLPIGDKAEGITTRGLYYPLEHATLPLGSSRGVSNEFVDEVAEVSLKKGLLLVITARD